MLKRFNCLTLLTAVLVCGPAFAQSGPEPGDEGAIQAYLAMWSHNADVTAAAVDRFYAPTVVYYGKRFSRCRVSVIMAWRRLGRDAEVSAGRARIAFDFVPVDGGRKIARESARPL